MWVEMFGALVAHETDQNIADRVNEAGGAVGRQSVGQWRKGATLPTRRNLVCLIQAFGATEAERARIVTAWLHAEDEATPKLNGQVIAVLDTETTGLACHDWAGVVEVGIVVLDPARAELGRLSMLTCPPVLDKRARRALEINKISPDLIKAAPGHPAAVIALRQFLRSFGYPPIVAFNAKFDQAMLARMGLQYRKWFCLMEAARAHFGHVVSLDKACRSLSIPRQDNHRALGDALDAAALIRALEQ